MVANTYQLSSGSPVLAFSDHSVISLHTHGTCPTGGTWSQEIIDDLGSALPRDAVADPSSDDLDDSAPTVCIDTPSDGAVVSGTVVITAPANDDRGVQSVELWIDGTSVSQDTSPPFSFQWDSQQSPNGVHAVEVVASDAAGNTASDSIELEVASCEPDDSGDPDETALAISFVSPTHGDVVDENEFVQVKVDSEHEVAWVEFSVNEEVLDTDHKAPFYVIWDTDGTTDPEVKLTARVLDSQNNNSEATITVFLNGKETDLPPQPEPGTGSVKATIGPDASVEMTGGCSAAPVNRVHGVSLLAVAMCALRQRRRR